MSKSKIFIPLVLAAALCGCDASSLGVGTGKGTLLSIIGCYTQTFELADPTSCVNLVIAQGMIPASISETAPYTIWVAEANSATAMSQIKFDPLAKTSTIRGVNVLAGVHAGGMTSWLYDSTNPQYALYLWHDETVEILSPATAGGNNFIAFSSGVILDFAISSDGTIGLAVAQNDTHLYPADLVLQNGGAAINLGSSAHPRAAAITPNNTRIYVTDSVNGTVYTTDLSGKTVGTIQVTSTPAELGKPAMLPDGSQVWIPDVTHNSVFSIDVGSGKSTPLGISGLLDPREIQFSPDGKTAYILSSPPAGFGPGRLSIVDTTSFAVSSTITLGNQPSGLALSPQGTIQFVANSGDGTVAVVQNGIVTTFTVGTTPVGVAPAR